jgi:hypothetical protein
MTNVLWSNGTSYAYYIPTFYLPLTILQPTYLPTNPPTHPPAYLDVLLTYLPIHPLRYELLIVMNANAIRFILLNVHP